MRPQVGMIVHYYEGWDGPWDGTRRPTAGIITLTHRIEPPCDPFREDSWDVEITLFLPGGGTQAAPYHDRPIPYAPGDVPAPHEAHWCWIPKED